MARRPRASTPRSIGPRQRGQQQQQQQQQQQRGYAFRQRTRSTGPYSRCPASGERPVAPNRWRRGHGRERRAHGTCQASPA
eukprot:ctg_5875.g482